MGINFVNIDVSTEKLYQTASRDYGTVAVVGDGGTTNRDPLLIGSTSEAAEEFASTDLGIGVKTALLNGASCVWAIDCGSTPTPDSVGTALAKIEGYDIQIVAMASIVETSDQPFVSTTLATHLDNAATERIGVFQLAQGENATTMPTAIGALLTGNKSRLFGVAHNSTSDVACAVAGLLAGLKPWESPLLKPITNVTQTVGFTSTQIDALEAAHINVLVDPIYVSGNSFVLGSDFTLGSESGGIAYIDTRRVVDDMVYKLKAGLTDPNIIGGVRINKAGLSIVRSRLAGILQGAVSLGEIDGYELDMPILSALSKAESSRSDAENLLITTARNGRAIDCSASIEYGGVLHIINLGVSITA